MLKKLKNNAKGFTIIEVMIVLAVAALIILIVLLAVPALQRSSRNTTIKSDAATVSAAVSDYETNNNGLVPAYVQSTDPTAPDGTVNVGKSKTDPNLITDKIQGSTVVWPEIANSAAAPTAAATSSTGSQTKLAPGQVVAYAGHKCDASVSARAVSIYYVTETGSANQLQCIDT